MGGKYLKNAKLEVYCVVIRIKKQFKKKTASATVTLWSQKHMSLKTRWTPLNLFLLDSVFFNPRQNILINYLFTIAWEDALIVFPIITFSNTLCLWTKRTILMELRPIKAGSHLFCFAKGQWFFLTVLLGFKKRTRSQWNCIFLIPETHAFKH